MAPPLQNFVDKVGPVVSAAWLNAVDVLTTTVFGQPPDAPTARTNLTLDAPLEVTNGGTGQRTLQGLFGQLYPPTAAEQSTGVVIVNQQFPPYTPDRYGTNSNQGVTDMWPAIFAADLAANADGAAVQFVPGEIYGINCLANGGPLTISSSWVCTGPQAIIRRIDFGVTTQMGTATAFQVANLYMYGLIFDGQVTTAHSPAPNLDLGPVGNYNDDSTEQKWSQVFGVFFRQTQNCTIENCTFMNFLRAGLRLDSGVSGGTISANGAPWVIFPGAGLSQLGTGTRSISLNNRVVNCRTIRTRGIFGDGFYSDNSESQQYVNCYAYDYQRIGFVAEFGSMVPNYGSNGSQYVNCVADFGHDAVTIGSQSNVGFWVESGDGISFTNCESKNTSVGFLCGSAANPSQGTFRPYTGSIKYVSCNAVRCNSSGFKNEFANRDAHVLYTSCFAEVNSTAAQYSGSVGVGANGFQLSFVATTGGPNPTSTVSAHMALTDCRVDMVNMSNVATAACVNVWAGGVTSPQQMQVNISGLSTNWLTAAGAADPQAQVQYASTAPPNFGYFGDIVFTGQNNGGARFGGRARIRDCSNVTTGYIMFSSEIAGANSILEIANTAISLRCGPLNANNGALVLKGCQLVDVRGTIGFTSVRMVNCGIADANPSNKDRTPWTGGEFILTGCFIQRQLQIVLAAGSSGNRSQSFTATGCEWFLQFPFSAGGEPGISFALGGGAFAAISLNGNLFRNVGGKSSATGSIIVNNSASTLQINGAGNAWDSGYTAAGGHLVQYNSTPTFNDNPAAIAAPFNSVNGSLQLWAPA